MQCLYAYERDAFVSPLAAKKHLQKSLDQAYILTLYVLYLLRETAKYSILEAEMRAAKHLPTKEDLNYSTKISENAIIQVLEGESFQKLIEQYQLQHIDIEDLPKELMRSLYTKPGYQKYTEVAENNLDDDRKALLTLFNKVFAQNDNLDQHLQENFTNGIDDGPHIVFKINKLLESADPETLIDQLKGMTINQEDREFADELFDVTLERGEEFSELIAPKLDNWELERIAVLDMILMKMALSELLHFQYIPVKVSINEYIEIAKMYSTPKSKDFINGVLDKLMRELKEAGKIKKLGRGLLG